MRRLAISCALAVAAAAAASAQFAPGALSPLSSESFRIGVEAYGRGRYAESLSQFERALSSDDSDPLALFWLGKAYYRLGLSAPAFERWREAVKAAGGSSFVESRLELAGALDDPSGLPEPERYVRVSELAGAAGKTTLFSRPSWIEPLPDGSAYLVSHGTNELLLLDANARVARRMNGGSTGFDRPFACVVLDDGTIFLSEFQADRVARLSPGGAVLGYSGDASGPGRLSGPQYLAADGDGFVYVVDSGFSRVVKYARDGSRVLAFGTASRSFDGLRMPTGIAVSGGVVYVADALRDDVLTFDPYGNYLGALGLAGLRSPEGLRALPDGRLLLADEARVLLVDAGDGSMKELFRSERRRARLTSTAFDANGELLAADFDASEILYLSDPETRFAGLSVEIDRVYADSFPRVSFDVSVRDKRGRPLAGLGAVNFYAAEGITSKERRIEGDKPVDYLRSSIRAVSSFAFEGALDASQGLELVFLLSAAPSTLSRRASLRDSIAAVMDSAGDGARARLVVAGNAPQPPTAPTVAAMTDAALKAAPQERWRFDSGLRLACGALFESQARRAVVYVGTGSVGGPQLGGTTLGELSDLLRHNGVRLYAILDAKEAPSPELRFLVESSGGLFISADAEAGLSAIPRAIRTAPTGRYRLSYLSQADDGFGRSYLPLSVEVYLRDRSGKDESGFFAPLR